MLQRYSGAVNHVHVYEDVVILDLSCPLLHRSYLKSTSALKMYIQHGPSELCHIDEYPDEF